MSLVEYVGTTEATGNRWVDLVQPAAELAARIAQTEFVPAEMRGKPAVVAACILYGAEIGIGPMMALAKVDIVKGRPAPKAELARALALAAGHDVWVVESSNTRVTVAGRRRGSEHEQRVTWTMDDVKKAGIVNQAYGKYPRQMLLARASAELVRAMCPDALGGIGQFAEEIEGAEAVETVQAAPQQVQATVGNKRSRRPLSLPSGPTEASLLPDEIEAEASADETITDDPDFNPDAITEKQMKMMMALMKERGLVDRDHRLTFTSGIIGRDIETARHLTKDEAGKVIDALTQGES